MKERVKHFFSGFIPLRHVVVEGESMAPGYLSGTHCIGVSRVFARKLSLGDVVIARRPQGDARCVVKRITGTPGETIYWQGLPYRLQKGEYFLEGDYKEGSTDSRLWGPVSLTHIEAKIVHARP